MNPLEILRAPKGFFEALRTQPPRAATPSLLIGLTVVLPILILALVDPGTLRTWLVSLILGISFLGAIALGIVLFAPGVSFVRALEIVGYSALPFVIAVLVFGLLSLLGQAGQAVGQGLTVGAAAMGWYRLFVGLEVMTGSRSLAWRGAILIPILAFVFTGFVPGLLLRLLGLV